MKTVVVYQKLDEECFKLTYKTYLFGFLLIRVFEDVFTYY